MKKAPLGLILFFYIGLLSGLTQSLPSDSRTARMDGTWGTQQKRAKVVDDAIIVEPEDESDYKEDQTGRAQILPFNRMAIRKRQIVSVDNDGKTHPGTPEGDSDNADLFRPLKRSIVSVDNEGQVSDGTPETGNDNSEYFWPLPGKRDGKIVSVDNKGQAYQDNSELFRPLPEGAKRSIVSVDNEGQISEGTPETGSDNEKYFRPLSTGYGKRSIVSVDNEGQTYQDNSDLFRPLPKEDKRGDSMMKWAKLPTNKKRSEEDCILNQQSAPAESELKKCCKKWFPTKARSQHNILHRQCASYL